MQLYSSSYPPHQTLMNVTLIMADVTTCVTIPLGATTARVDQDTHYKKMASLVWVSVHGVLYDNITIYGCDINT